MKNAAASLPPAVHPGLFATAPATLLGGRCEACGTLRFPHRNLCPRCQSTQVAVVPLSRHGTVHTYTIVRSKPPGYLGAVPYAFGLVELPEGLRVASTLTARDIETIAVGDKVEFELITLGEGDDAVLSYAYRRREKR
jgi:uncharacterized OB-fold protein